MRWTWSIPRDESIFFRVFFVVPRRARRGMLNSKINNNISMTMASAASSRRNGLLRRSPVHLRFLLVLAIKLLLIEGSESFAITERSWQYK